MNFTAAERTLGNAIKIYLGGEKVFDYACGYSKYAGNLLSSYAPDQTKNSGGAGIKFGTKIFMYRLNFAVDLR